MNKSKEIKEKEKRVRFKSVICKSGALGYQCRLRRIYDCFKDFDAYAQTYGLHKKLGYISTKMAWSRNPVIEASLNPDDYRKVKV